ncbi:MAG: four helix bundle protein [Alphaproteobacteria bacterium]|nr:four helix bundle protein [Alphaproteobacteria bacterium]
MYRFLLWLVPAVEKFPRSQKFLLGDRIQATALDVLERLIEAPNLVATTQSIRRRSVSRLNACGVPPQRCDKSIPAASIDPGIGQGRACRRRAPPTKFARQTCRNAPPCPFPPTPPSGAASP